MSFLQTRNLFTAAFAFLILATLPLKSMAGIYAINLTMNGSKVVPPVTTSAIATLNGTYNDVTNELIFTVNFSGMSGLTIGAHFHAPATSTENAGVEMIWTGFPLGVTSGSYSKTFILLAHQETMLMQGRFYADIHSAYAFNGEIRSQVNLQLRVFQLDYLIEGLYNFTLNKQVRDTVTINLRSSSWPYSIVDSERAYLDTTGRGIIFFFNNAPSFTPLYVQILHRNGLETWSRVPVSFTSSLLYVNFTTAANQAYGDNLIQKGTRFCAYSGDVNQDGVIDATDASDTDNDAMLFITGYVSTDVNGDGFVDGTDFAIVDNDVALYVSVMRP